MRVGVIGGGYWGSKHVRVLAGLSEVEEVVLVETRHQVRDALCADYPRLRACADLDEALPHVDALVIATPPTSHAPLGITALDAGKHVLVEKPLATEPSDARKLVDLADDNGLVLMSGHTFEYNAAVWALRDAVAAGDLGDVYYVDTARLNLGLYQPDVNVVWDLAPHDISIVNHVLGCSPDVVQAWGSTHAHVYLEDVAYLRLEYHEMEVTAQVHVSWLDPRKVRRVTVVGSRKMAVFNDLADDERIRIYDRGVESSQGHGNRLDGHPVAYRNNGMVSPSIALEEPLQVEDRHFVDCVRHGRRPATDGMSGLAVVEVLAAARDSLRDGRPVRLDRHLLGTPVGV